MEPVRQYVATKVADGFPIDGDLNKAPWRDLPWTEEFVDIFGGDAPKPWHRTRAKMAYSDHALYIAAELEEPNVWATLTQHDSVIFQDNDFEVFLDPDGDQCLYAELELNALNTTWDLLLVRPYRAGGPAIDGFELAGLKTAVRVDGTLNDPTDKDRGWSVEIMIPWTALKDIARCPCPPRTGDQWRINFSRVQWHTVVKDRTTTKVAGKPEENWVWSPQGVVDMHRPHRWGVVQFGGEPRPLDGAAARDRLVEIWETQLAYRAKHGRYAKSESEYGISGVEMMATPTQFRARFGGWVIDHDARLAREATPD